MARNPIPIHSDIAFSRCAPKSEADCQQIREQLGRVLESGPFRTSKRYPALLTYVVEKALQNDTEALKERTLGVEVFHRLPQYDTNADPVVRIAASEVRKRLAQYYYDSSRSSEIHIELPPGSYVPEFYVSTKDGEKPDGDERPGSTAPSQEASVTSPSLSAPSAAVGKMQWRVVLPIICLILGFFGGAIANRMQNRVASAPLSPIDEFWRPLISAPGTVWLCVGESYVSRIELDPNGARNRFDSRYSLSSDQRKTYPALNLADSTALARVAGLLQSRNKNYSVHGESETTFSDLVNQPSILIGSFNNDWTIRLSDQLRFHFEMNRDTGEQWIVDRQKPNEKIGVHSFNLAAQDTSDAYAIISRVRDPSTGQMVVALAGVSANGTKAAGTFVSDPTYLDELAKRASRNWQNANLQIVIASSIVDGSLGPPRVVSYYAW
jgi:hypothetical protein